MVLVPDVLGEVLGYERFAVGGELRPSLEIFSSLQLVGADGSAGRALGVGLGDTFRGVAAHFGEVVCSSVYLLLPSLKIPFKCSHMILHLNSCGFQSSKF